MLYVLTGTSNDEVFEVSTRYLWKQAILVVPWSGSQKARTGTKEQLTLAPLCFQHMNMPSSPDYRFLLHMEFLKALVYPSELDTCGLLLAPLLPLRPE